MGIWWPFWREEEGLTLGEGGVEALERHACRQLGCAAQQLVNPSGLEGRMVQNLPKSSAVLAGESASVSLLSQVCPAPHWAADR